jgi:hypothetical protein
MKIEIIFLEVAGSINAFGWLAGHYTERFVCIFIISGSDYHLSVIFLNTRPFIRVIN